jgi:hypothetical protein
LLVLFKAPQILVNLEFLPSSLHVSAPSAKMSATGHQQAPRKRTRKNDALLQGMPGRPSNPPPEAAAFPQHENHAVAQQRVIKDLKDLYRNRYRRKTIANLVCLKISPCARDDN